jgi:hypothetical protein
VTPLRRRAYLACALCIGTCLCFFLTELLPLPVPIYYPIARRWSLGPGAVPGLAMDYYGRSLLALLGGGVFVLATLLALWIAARREAPAGPADTAPHPVLLLCTAWAATAFVLCASLYAYKLGGRDLVPDPLPAWYQPR